jgi:hypothetical protein
MTQLKGSMKVGDTMYSTRASYYGVKCTIIGFEEVRGRNLVHVLCTTTKKGRELEEDKFYERRFSPKFLQAEPVTEPYVRRRPTEIHDEDDGGVTDPEALEAEDLEEVEDSDDEAPVDEPDDDDDEEDEEEEDDEEEDDEEDETDEDESGESDEESWS